MALCEQNMATQGRCSAQNWLYLVYLNTRWCSGGPTLQMMVQRTRVCTMKRSWGYLRHISPGHYDKHNEKNGDKDPSNRVEHCCHSVAIRHFRLEKPPTVIN